MISTSQFTLAKSASLSGSSLHTGEEVTLTLHPAPGDARKEILFTRKGSTLYAILPLRPAGALVARGVAPAKGSKIALLGSTHANLAWKQRGADLVVTLPALADGELPFSGPLVVKIEGVTN